MAPLLLHLLRAEPFSDDERRELRACLERLRNAQKTDQARLPAPSPSPRRSRG
jgi:hypothetical protein